MLNWFCVNDSINHSGFVVGDEDSSAGLDQDIHRPAVDFAILSKPAGDEIFRAEIFPFAIEPYTHNFITRRHGAVPGAMIGDQEIVPVFLWPALFRKESKAERS